MVLSHYKALPAGLGDSFDSLSADFSFLGPLGDFGGFIDEWAGFLAGISSLLLGAVVITIANNPNITISPVGIIAGNKE